MVEKLTAEKKEATLRSNGHSKVLDHSAVNLFDDKITFSYNDTTGEDALRHSLNMYNDEKPIAMNLNDSFENAVPTLAKCSEVPIEQAKQATYNSLSTI